jgi:hypothetical protein
MSSERFKNAPSRAHRIPTAAVVVAVLLLVGAAAYAYASSNGGTPARPCHRVEAGIANCVASHSILAGPPGVKLGVSHFADRSLNHVRGRARRIGVPADCNGLCPEDKQLELVEAVAPLPAAASVGAAPSPAPTSPPATSGTAPSKGAGSSAGSGSGAGSGSSSGSGSESSGSEENGGSEDSGGSGGGVETSKPTPPVVETSCSLGAAASAVSMYVPGCLLSASDLASEESPLDFWGSIQCADESRYAYVQGGGDTHLSATGEQTDGNYRRLTVLDGDDYSGERCELGENSTSGPTAFYHEGENVLTYYSERLPSNFPLDTNNWQVTMQMKQAQPSHDDGSGVALEMEARDNRWIVSDLWHEVASFPATANTWTRFAWNVYYSKDPSKGWVQVSVDLNGDGDFDDPGERSPLIHAATLATELPEYAGEDGLEANSGIPSHLRMGIYHDPAIECPAPTGCSVDVDNVQVVRPAP